MFTLFYFAYVIFLGFVWRLRGGAFHSLTGIDLGTNVTRLIIGILIGASTLALGFSGVSAAGIALAVPTGLVVAGWGPFAGMGDHLVTPKETWLSFFPQILGIKPASLTWDIFGMFTCGLFLFIPMFVVFFLTTMNFSLLWYLPVVAIFFMLSYLITNRMQKVLPVFKNIFEVFEDWAELLVGMEIGILFLVISLFS